MRDQGSGSVINISSMFGLVASAPVPDAGYVASKSAVNGLTRELASQWARDGVRVNAIAPGFFAQRDDRRARGRRAIAALVRTHVPDGPARAARGARRHPALPRVRRVELLHRAGLRDRRRLDDPMTARSRGIDVDARRRLARRPRPGARAAAHLHAHRRGPVEPDLPRRRRRRAAGRPAPAAARGDPRLRARRRARAPHPDRAAPGRLPGPAHARRSARTSRSRAHRSTRWSTSTASS